MSMLHLGHVYIPILTTYQFIHAPLDLYAIRRKLGLGGGSRAFCHQVVCPCQSLACRSKSSKPVEKYSGGVCL